MIRNTEHQPYPGAKATAAARSASAPGGRARRAKGSSMARGAESLGGFAPCGAAKLEGQPAVGLRLDDRNFDSQT